jgi:hypothetical protein
MNGDRISASSKGAMNRVAFARTTARPRRSRPNSIAAINTHQYPRLIDVHRTARRVECLLNAGGSGMFLIQQQPLDVVSSEDARLADPSGWDFRSSHPR